MSVEVWVKTTGPSGRLVSPVGDAWDLEISGGLIGFRLFGQSLTSVQSVADDAWHHVVATWQGGTVATARLYVDNVPAQWAVPGTLPRSAGGLVLGANPAGGSNFEGVMEDVQVYDSALTAAHVTRQYNLGWVGPTTSSGVVFVTAGANPTASARTGMVTIANQSVTISQAGRPGITSLNRTVGTFGQAVTITGTNFGAAQAQGSGSVTFNGATAFVTSWGAATIGVIVPASATTGPVVVSVEGLASNGVTFTVNGALPAPVASPGTGNYLPGQTVALSAVPGAQIRYTLNGTEPTASSSLYSAPIEMATGLITLKAVAFEIDWTPSQATTAIYTITTDVTPPTITAAVSPAPSAAGWYGTTVTVTFTCADSESAIASCSPPTLVSIEGPDLTITGEARDAVGNRATVSVSLNVDLSEPFVTVSAPGDGAVVPTGTASVTVRGTAIDALSGIGAVTCSGAAATMSGGLFTCAVAVSAGSNVVHVAALDVVGRAAMQDVTIVVGDEPASTAIAISPANMTMIAGETRRIAVNNNRGRPVVAGPWTVSEALVAEVIDENGVTSVHALGAGQTTVTVTYQGLTAQATVTVLAADSTTAGGLPSGTTIWSLSGGTVPMRGRVLRAVPSDSADASEAAALFFVVEGTEWVGGELVPRLNHPTRIRATTIDGRQLWEWGFTDRLVKHVAADNNGGIVAVFDAYHDGTNTYHPANIRRLDGVTGGVTWEYAVVGNLSKVAIHPDGRVFATEEPYYGATTYLTAIGENGAVQKWGLPKGHAIRYVLGVKDIDGDTEADASGPIIREDGSVVVVSHAVNIVWYANHNVVGDDPERVSLSSARSHVTLTELLPEAAQPVFHEVDFSAAARTPRLGWQEDVVVSLQPRENTLLPDGHDGLLIGQTRLPFVHRLSGGSQQTYALSAGQWLTSFFPVNTYNVEYVLGEEGAHAVALGSGTSSGTPYYWAKDFIFDPQTLTVLSEAGLGSATATPKHLQLQFAIAGGGAYVSGPTEAYLVNASVSATGFPAGGLGTQVVPGVWDGWQSSPVRTMGFGPVVGITDFAYVNANSRAGNGPPDLCAACSKGFRKPPGHGPASPSDIRRIITVVIDSSWSTSSNQPHPRVLAATECAIRKWNEATDSRANHTGYFFKLDQDHVFPGTADLTIVDEPCTIGAGFACESSNPEDQPTTIRLPHKNVEVSTVRDEDICGRIAHEFAHKIGGYSFGWCKRSILHGTDPNQPGTGRRLDNDVSPDDVELVNEALVHPTRCIGERTIGPMSEQEDVHLGRGAHELLISVNPASSASVTNRDGTFAGVRGLVFLRATCTTDQR